MPNNLTADALPGTGADAGSMAQQGPQVDAAALETPPAQPTSPAGPGAQQSVSPADVKDMIHKQSVVDHKLRAILAKDGQPTKKDVTTMAVELVADRILSAQSMAGYLNDLPTEPDQIKEWLERHAKDAENSLQQLLIMLHGSEAQGPQAGGPTPGAPPGMPGMPDMTGTVH